VLVLVLVLVLSGRIHSHTIHTQMPRPADAPPALVRLRRMEQALMTCFVDMDDYDAATV
jgi:hypothetical protein